MTSLSVISKGFLGVLIGGSLLLWFAALAVRRRRGRLAVVGVVALAAVFSLASAADAVNAHYQYLPRLSDVIGQRDWPTASRAQLSMLEQPAPSPSSSAPSAASPAVSPPRPVGKLSGSRPVSRVVGTHPDGAVVTIAVPDAGVGFSGNSALVYLPPQYFTESAARFPVVYLLHGSPGIPVDWLRGADAAKAGERVAAAGGPQILVMPHLSRDWLDDSECVDGAHTRVETYVVRDLVPAVDSQLRTLRDRLHRGVAGMSAGGYCALNLGLRHRDLFGQIIDMSGFTHPTHSGGMAALFGRRSDLPAVVAANSPDQYVDTLSPSPMTQLYLLCGTADGSALREMTNVRDRLRARGFDVSWATRPGGHTYGVWRPGLADALQWAAAMQAGVGAAVGDVTLGG